MSLIGCVLETVEIWPDCMILLVSNIRRIMSTKMSPDLVHEISVYAQMVNDSVQSDYPARSSTLLSTSPAHTCVTIRIPQSQLGEVDPKHLEGRSTLALRCVAEPKGSNKDSEQYFTNLQIFFGEHSTIQDAEKNVRTYIEDPSGWCGTSDMHVSFFVPTDLVELSTSTPIVIIFGLLPFQIVDFMKIASD